MKLTWNGVGMIIRGPLVDIIETTPVLGPVHPALLASSFLGPRMTRMWNFSACGVAKSTGQALC